MRRSHFKQRSAWGASCHLIVKIHHQINYYGTLASNGTLGQLLFTGCIFILQTKLYSMASSLESLLAHRRTKKASRFRGIMDHNFTVNSLNRVFNRILNHDWISARLLVS